MCKLLRYLHITLTFPKHLYLYFLHKIILYKKYMHDSIYKLKLNWKIADNLKKELDFLTRATQNIIHNCDTRTNVLHQKLDHFFHFDLLFLSFELSFFFQVIHLINIFRYHSMSVVPICVLNLKNSIWSHSTTQPEPYMFRSAHDPN